jgi:hypothetical protein
MSNPAKLQINQGHSLGPFGIVSVLTATVLFLTFDTVLGASIHDILARIKSLPLVHPAIQVSYSQNYPVLAPIVILLPENGLRLRFDGPDQRLRLIEVLDFSKTCLIYNQEDLVSAQTDGNSEALARNNPSSKTGPSFRRVYNRFGPTTPGEYFKPEDKGEGNGTYVLSYPGIAFSFPLQPGTWNTSMAWASTVSLLSSTATGPATSLSIFSGKSWKEARSSMFSADMPGFLRSPIPPGLKKEQVAKEIEWARVYDKGRVELVRSDAPSFWIILGETTPQDLVTELGPPDTIHHKNDRRVSIHRARKGSSVSHSRRGSSNSETHSPNVHRGMAPLESDQSSRGESSDSEEDGDEVLDDSKDSGSEQVFYNYYSHGFDILISPPTKPSTASPAAPHDTHGVQGDSSGAALMPLDADDPVLPRNHLTATKVIFHGNAPGSWAFNRHRRLRWSLESVVLEKNDKPLTSETHWRDIQIHLQKVFHNLYENEEEERAASLPMVVNRGWGREESGVDAEWGVVGGWEDGTSTMKRKDYGKPGDSDQERMGAAEVYGFPGLIFEVLKNGAVSCLTVY